MDLKCENIVKVLAYVLGVYVALRIIQDNCNIGLGGFFRSVESMFDRREGFDGVAAAESSGNA